MMPPSEPCVTIPMLLAAVVLAFAIADTPWQVARTLARGWRAEEEGWCNDSQYHPWFCCSSLPRLLLRILSSHLPSLLPPSCCSRTVNLEGARLRMQWKIILLPIFAFSSLTAKDITLPSQSHAWYYYHLQMYDFFQLSVLDLHRWKVRPSTQLGTTNLISSFLV